MKLGMKLVTFLTVVLAFQSAFTEENKVLEAPPSSKANVYLDLPVFDIPYNTTSYYPNLYSMRQSLALSTDFYQGFHRLLGGPPETQKRRIWLIAGLDLISFYTPLGNAWMHEEWHRAVMSHRGIGSFNDVNTFPIGKTLIAVSHVDDQDLIALKRDHPADQVRLSSAGMESQVAQNMAIEKTHFYDGTKTFDQIVLWMNAVNVTSYLASCSSKDADKSTDDQNKDDGADLSRRDFTGLDCTAWVYDLFRPDEPYAARGTHPSGIGINRYIKYSALSEKEKSFLQLQTGLSILNIVDPFLIGFESFKAEAFGEPLVWNAKLSHSITSFGATVDVNLFLKARGEKFLFIYHHGLTDTRTFPGVTAEWIDKALPWDKFSLSTALTLWQQPQDQRVEETRGEILVDGMAKVAYQHTPEIASYVGFEAKTPGWLAGNVYLEKNVSLWAGLRVGGF
jgi:hypothetical protein